MPETHISSLIIHLKLERMPEVRDEIPAENPNGKMIAVIESSSESFVSEFATDLAVRDGVTSTNLVFHLVEDTTTNQMVMIEQREPS